MPTVQPFPAGGYRFISHQFQYSGGVAAEPGFRIERARFARSVPLADGFDAIEAYLAGIGRSPTAFCACELLSPAQFTDAGLSLSIGTMSSGWPPGGFSATRSTRLPARTSARKSTHPPRRPSTPSAIRCRAKAARRAALSLPEAAKRARAAPAMRGASSGPATTHPRRCARKQPSYSGRWSSAWQALGFSWADVTATQVYTIFEIHPLLADQFVRRGAMSGGLAWHFARPPVQGLDFRG